MSKEKKAEKAEKKLEKKAKKQAEKEERKRRREKPYSVHVNTRNRIIKIAIWTAVAFFVLLGAFSFATREDSSSVKRTLSKAVADINQSSSGEERASSLALAFVHDYFSYDPDAQDAYLERINAYAADGLTFDLPTSDAVTSVKTASVKDIASDGHGNVDVTVQAKVQSSGMMQIATKLKDKDGKETETVSQQAQTTERLLDYRVPVDIEDGNCAVVAVPLLVADQNTAKRVSIPDGLAGESVDETEQKNVTVLAGNFLKAYYGSDRNELLYFVTSDFGSTSTVGEGIRFKEVTEIDVVGIREGAYEAEVKYVISDNMVEQPQKAYLEVVRGAEGRLYVDRLKTRQ